ncbi:MAG: hypothetical protein K2L46_05805 [Paramuribaculum sp.]|nr:hypothetical protein [Paramuribaculum sp.]MDE6324439.1 hypothetical protein [Paramuribaculum sp.]MDE6488779.1 hypothetical protein [Paramuribaculum sp.]
MRRILLGITILSTSGIIAGCNSNSKETTAETDVQTEDSTSIIPDTIDINQRIAWRAAQGMPLYPDEIDTILAYYEAADKWTGEHVGAVHSPADLDSLEARYLRQFPYLEIYSMILENYADIIMPEQLDRLQATAESLGAKVDRAAKAAGIDPSEINPLHGAESRPSEINNPD